MNCRKSKCSVAIIFLLLLSACDEPNVPRGEVETHAPKSSLKFIYLPILSLVETRIIVADSGLSDGLYQLKFCVSVANRNEDKDVLVPLKCSDFSNFILVSSDKQDSLTLEYEGNSEYAIIKPNSEEKFYLLHWDIPQSYQKCDEYIFKMTQLLNKAELYYWNKCSSGSHQVTHEEIVLSNQVVVTNDNSKFAIEKIVR